jgi:hypothetical protein
MIKDLHHFTGLTSRVDLAGESSLRAGADSLGNRRLIVDANV